jgi:UDP-glucose 4-epimerase
VPQISNDVEQARKEVMKVLVTGATGRVGANMVKRLVANGAEVRAMAFDGDPQLAKLETIPQAEVAIADLADQRSLDTACKGVTHVVHLAAQLVRGRTPVDKFYDVNAIGTLRLLEAARKNDRFERFVLASTDGTYRPGAPPRVPLDEDTVQQPGDYYGTAKLLGEVILKNHSVQFDLPFSIVRFATVVSPEESRGYFTLDHTLALLARAGLGKDTNIWPLFVGQPDMARLLRESSDGMPGDCAVALVGPGGEPWSIHMVDVRDAVEGVYSALTNPAALGEAFNIAAGEPTSYVDGSRAIAAKLHVPRITVEMPVTWRLELSISKAQKALGYQPKYLFAETLDSHLDFSADVIPARL